MYISLLLPLLLASGPGQPAAVAKDDPPIQIWINNDGRFLRGDRAKVHVRTEDDGYLVVLHADAEGHLRVLFPLDPRDDNFVRGGKKYEVEGRGGRDAFDVGDRSGRGSVYAAVSSTPFRFDDVVLSDHWDYRALEPNRLAEDPEPELTELVRRMAQGNFDYDVMSYYVVERVVYANDYSYTPYYSNFYYDGFGCGYYHSCGSSFAFSLSFGRPFYRRHYYSPIYYGYDPFYDPFFYDPYYYRPFYHNVYYRPYYYRPVYYSPYYWRYPHSYRNAGYFNRWDRALPYRNRALVNADFRDRRYTFGRAVNTVYTPPVTRFTEPEKSSPVRRAVDRREMERPEAVVSRRADDPRTDPRTSSTRSGDTDGRRVADRRNESNTIEARRARPAEPTRTVTDGRGRENMPVDVSPRRASTDRSSAGGDRSAPEATRAREARPMPEARRSGGSDGSRSTAPRSEPRSYDRGDRGGSVDRGGSSDRGGDRGGRSVERAPSYSPSPSHSGGGDRGGGGGRSPSSNGGRRR